MLLLCCATLKVFPQSSPCYEARNRKNQGICKAAIVGAFPSNCDLKRLTYRADRGRGVPVMSLFGILKCGQLVVVYQTAGLS
jgi:hypothetical protein